MVRRKCVRHRERERESTKDCLSGCLVCEKPDASLQMWSGLFNTTYKAQQNSLYPFVFCSAPNHPPTAPKPTSHHDKPQPHSQSICLISDPSFPKPLQGLALNITSLMLQLHGAKLHREGPSAFSMWSQTGFPPRVWDFDRSLFCLPLADPQTQKFLSALSTSTVMPNQTSQWLF